MTKRPVSVLVVVHTTAPQFLLMRRAGTAAFWQSITGSLEDGETPLDAARRELEEETGLAVDTAAIFDWRLRNRFPILPRWRARYADGVSHNVEHVFSVCLPAQTPVHLAPDEHVEARWVSVADALSLAWSWTNRDAIRLVADR